MGALEKKIAVIKKEIEEVYRIKNDWPPTGKADHVTTSYMIIDKLSSELCDLEFKKYEKDKNEEAIKAIRRGWKKRKKSIPNMFCAISGIYQMMELAGREADHWIEKCDKALHKIAAKGTPA